MLSASSLRASSSKYFLGCSLLGSISFIFINLYVNIAYAAPVEVTDEKLKVEIINRLKNTI